jgi:hypothetical protein
MPVVRHHLVTESGGAWGGARAQFRRYLKPVGVLAVVAAGVLCAFAAWWTRYLNSVSAADPVQIPLLLLFLELGGYYVNAIQLHVHAADVLVRCGIHREDFR